MTILLLSHSNHLLQPALWTEIQKSYEAFLSNNLKSVEPFFFIFEFYLSVESYFTYLKQ